MVEASASLSVANKLSDARVEWVSDEETEPIDRRDLRGSLGSDDVCKPVVPDFASEVFGDATKMTELTCCVMPTRGREGFLEVYCEARAVPCIALGYRPISRLGYHPWPSVLVGELMASPEVFWEPDGKISLKDEFPPSGLFPVSEIANDRWEEVHSIQSALTSGAVCLVVANQALAVPAASFQ